ncbi:MAG: phosphoribosylformylglycinamidine synthase [Pseudomonadota bacterium]
MSQLIRLRGRSALSSFRLNKLHQSLSPVLPEVRVATEFWHFAYVSRQLDSAERERLERLLTYGPASAAPAEHGTLLLVTPRLGTISPWSSKATDIAQHCGLEVIERIERGVAYWVEQRDGQALNSDQRLALLPYIHDRMTETVLGAFDEVEHLFRRLDPQPLRCIDVLSGGSAALASANKDMGLALSEDEIAYLAQAYHRMRRNPTDVELMMFAQANSEHCRHKIFNADWTIDGQVELNTLFGMIRTTHAKNPRGTVVAYSDNSSVIEGAPIARFYPDAQGTYRYRDELTHILMKVETHNHPTAIAPYPGAATGSGGEIRDEGATGRGSKPKAGLTGFSVSNLRIPDFEQPWEEAGIGAPSRIASALQIMLDGPIGGAAFNNEFGRPNLAGYFRTFEQRVGDEVRGYHKPIMIAGGVGNIAAEHTHKAVLPAGALIIQIGGPAMLIGLGGGAASSMDTGTNQEDLDFDSVQRGNAEIERRAQEVIDRCWALRELNPILSIHDVGAGGLSNALPELVHTAGMGGRFDLRSIPSEEPGMSPMQIWCNEAQERYVLAIAPADLAAFKSICERERCPFAVVGVATDDGKLTVIDTRFDNNPVDMALSVLLGKPPRMRRDVTRIASVQPVFDLSVVDLVDAAQRVLSLPSVADKTFLITIGDRSVGGLTARDQMVGPWQTPVSDVAVTAMGYDTVQGEAFAMGERTPLALVSAEASGRMAIAEALTNIAAAAIDSIHDVKLSANWMAAAGHPGEDAALYDTVRSVALDLCPALGISIPVGKDSLSMKTAWMQDGKAREVTAPLSLIVTAFAPVSDVRRTLTPYLQSDAGETVLMLIDLSRGQARLGGSALAQVYGCVGNVAPDVDDAQALKQFFTVIQQLSRAGLLLAYHDRSDGGLFVTLCEMMFASHVGITLDIHCGIVPDALSGTLAALFNEELGAVVQVRANQVQEVRAAFERAGLSACLHAIGKPNTDDTLRIVGKGREIYAQSRVALQLAWSATTFQMQRLRDNPECAQEEYDRILDATDPGLHAVLTFDPDEDIAASLIPNPSLHGRREKQARGGPRVAILREQGVNGQMEMAAAFDRAGFTAADVHMSDIIAGRVSLKEFAGFAACGGFSYGDVLGAGEGWAKSILFNSRACDEFTAFFDRADTFALGVCNGCQMMANLRDIIPGAQHWPHFVRNRSEQFEARFAMVEVGDSPSMFFSGMQGSRIPIAVSHGEGYAEFRSDAAIEAAQLLVTLRYVDNHGRETQRYPFNPNGSARGITGLTTPDGRYSVLMPHPERVFRTVSCSWHPREWGADSPWLRIFRNARKFVG